MAQIERVWQNQNKWFMALALLLSASALIVLPLTTAVAVIGGVLAFAALLRWPELALYGIILAVPYGSWFPIPLGAGNLTAVDLLVALVLALWLARMIAQTRSITIRWPPLAVPFALFLFAAFLSTTGALSLMSSVKELVKWVEMFALYVYIANTLDAGQANRALVVLFLAGLSEAAIGIYQFIFRVGPEGFALFGTFMRAYGTFEQPNPYGGYLGLIIPIALGIVAGVLVRRQAAKDAGRPTSLAVRAGELALVVLASISFVAMAAALLMSWSRGAWLGVAAGSVVAVVLQSRRAFVLSGLAAFVLTVVILIGSLNIIPPEITARFNGVADYFGVFDVRGVQVNDANYAIVERMAHWQAAWDMFLDHPLLGVGFGNYADVYPAYALPNWSDPLGHAHNYYLNVLGEAGLVGLTGYVLLWAAVFWQGWRTVRTTSGWWGSVAAGLLGMVVVLSVHNTFDDLFVHGMAVQVGLGLGMVAAITQMTK